MTARGFAKMALALAAMGFTQTAAAQICGTDEIIREGDTLSSIAGRCGITAAELADPNPYIAPEALISGKTVIVDGYDPTPAIPDLPPTEAGDPPVKTYFDILRGVWRGDGFGCGTRVGTWAFDTTSLRGNATIFDLHRILGTADRVVMETTRRTDGRDVRLIAVPGRNGTLGITGPGIATDLTECIASPLGVEDMASSPTRTDVPQRRPLNPSDLSGTSDGVLTDPLDVYSIRFEGLWRGTDSTCDGLVGTWDFRRDAIRANATQFAIVRLSGREDRVEVLVRDESDRSEKSLRLILKTLENATVTGPGIATDLVKCAL